jgi:hypothetical protein
MSDITVTAAKVGATFPQSALIRDYVATETITAGQAVYLLTTGKIGVADANAAGKQKAFGLALNGGGAGQAISVIHRGEVEGFTLAGNAGALVYLSDTVGALADAAGTLAVEVGRIRCLSDANLTKVLFVDFSFANPQGTRIFSSSEQTGTGSSQNVAHGLGVTPTHVLVSVTELPDAAAETGFDVAEGTHTSTNVVVTVTNTVKFKVLAIAYV